jgi:hypothetical protein
MQSLSSSLSDCESIEVTKVPKLDRFFPDCELGLLELVARAEWAIPDLKKAWFNNTFVFRREGSAWLAPNQIELNASLTPVEGDRARAFARLEKYYQIRTIRRVFPDFASTWQDVYQTLRRGKPAITCVEMSFLQDEGRGRGLFQPHMVAIVGWDRQRAALKIVDQVRDTLWIPMAHYEESFGRYAANRRAFDVLHCTREVTTPPLPLSRDDVHEEIRFAVDNLRSPAAHLGLNGLCELASVALQAVKAERRPFAIPGVWLVSHDRHALRQTLQYWREADVADTATLRALDRALKASFVAWFEIDMGIERSLREQSAAQMKAVAEAIRQVIPLEESIASLLEKIAWTGHERHRCSHQHPV